MTENEKEELLSTWNSCDRETRMRLAGEYLAVMNPGDGQLGWLLFLQANLLEDFLMA
jgi:hypothetical protein